MELQMTTLNTDLQHAYIPIAGAANRYAILKTGMHFYDDGGYQFLISNIRLDREHQLICMDAVGSLNSITGIEESYTCTFVSGSLIFDELYVNPTDIAAGSCERHMIPDISHLFLSGVGSGDCEAKDEGSKSTELFSPGDTVLIKDSFKGILGEVILLIYPIYKGDNFARILTKQMRASRHCIKGKTLTKIGSFTVPEGVR